MTAKNPHVGSNFDDFLREEGIRDEVQDLAVKKAISLGLQNYMQKTNLTKSDMAEIIGTSRAQLDRILDPKNDSVNLSTLKRAAHAIGKKLCLSLV